MRGAAIRQCVVGLICLFISFGLGCSSSGRASESEKAVSSMKDTRAQLANAKTEVNDAMASLDALASGSNLQKSFSAYDKDVTNVKAAGDKARARWQSMQENGKAYIARWQTEAAQIQNPEIKSSMEQRRQRVADNYEKIKTTAQATKDAYQPFLQQLQSIQKALSLDLSQAGASALQPEMAKAKTQGQTLNQKIDALISQLDEIMGGMSPPTPPKS